MAKLECICAYWHRDKDGMLIKSYDDVPEGYTNLDGSRTNDRVIYEVDDSVVDELMASGCFKRA